MFKKKLGEFTGWDVVKLIIFLKVLQGFNQSLGKECLKYLREREEKKAKVVDIHPYVAESEGDVIRPS